MIVNADILRKETIKLIQEIDSQIEWVYKESHDPTELIPLLQAKATAYNTLVLLQQPKK